MAVVRSPAPLFGARHGMDLVARAAVDEAATARHFLFLFFLLFPHHHAAAAAAAGR
jgi:hypothetical protein